MKSRRFSALKVFIFVFLGISVLFPLLNLILTIDINDIKTILGSETFMPMLLNSLIATLSATAISVLLAFGLAWCVNRSNIKYKSIFSILFTLPMLIPSISHGMGLVLLFGDSGLITNFLGININLYGFTGIIFGSVLYSFPVAFLMLTDDFRYEDYTAYEAAEVMGLSKYQQFKCLTLSNMGPSLLSVVFAVFTLIFTDYGVPLVVGGKVMTLPVYMYREVIGLLDYSKGAVIGIVLLIPAFIAFILDLNKKERGNSGTVTKSYVIKENKVRDILSYLFCIVTIFIISLPILAFIYLSFVKQYPIDMSFSLDNIKQAFHLGLGMYTKNSIGIALCTAIIGLCVTYFTAYITSRSKKSFSNMVLHLISMVSLAVPGVVLGLCYVLFYHGSFIYGTIIILVMVNVTHFFASPYLLAYNSLNKFNKNFEDNAACMGISKMQMLFDVYIPCTKDTIIEMFSYLFVNAMVTISAISFLANFKNMPLSLLIPQFDSQSLIEATAFISVVILVVNGILKLGVYLLKRNINRHEMID